MPKYQLIKSNGVSEKKIATYSNTVFYKSSWVFVKKNNPVYVTNVWQKKNQENEIYQKTESTWFRLSAWTTKKKKKKVK